LRIETGAPAVGAGAGVTSAGFGGPEDSDFPVEGATTRAGGSGAGAIRPGFDTAGVVRPDRSAPRAWADAVSRRLVLALRVD